MHVELREGESQESLVGRFQKMIQHEGLLRELKERRYFLSNGERERLARRKAARRRRRSGR